MLALALLFGFMFVIDHVSRIRFKNKNPNYLVTSIFALILLASLYFCTRNAFPTLNMPPQSSPTQITGSLPFVNFKIVKFDLDSVSGALMLKLRLANTSDSHHAYNLNRATQIKLDSVSASDSAWAVEVLKRHKYEGVTLGPRELEAYPIEMGKMVSSIKNRPRGSVIRGVREFFRDVDFLIIGAYTYLDEAGNRYLCTYCISYDPWTDTQRPYRLFNSHVLVRW